MRVRGRIVLEAFYASWNAKDLDAALSCFSDDVVLIIHLPTDVVPYGGETRGKAELEQMLQAALREFEFLDYRPILISDVGNTRHAQVHFHIRHKRTGHEVEGTLRHIWQIDGDKIVRLEEPRYRAPGRVLQAAGHGWLQAVIGTPASVKCCQPG